MAREPVKMNSVVSTPGQVGNRAAYMRPGTDRSGSKALSQALGSLSGSLSKFNQQVDRYQAAERQSQIEAAQKFQNEEVQRLSLEGQLKGMKGEGLDASHLQDSPIFQAAYQEGHITANMQRRLTQLERETNWEQFNDDVDAGHDKLQAFLLEQGEGMMAGYSPEIQAKFYSQYRTWSSNKMAAQATAAKENRVTNMKDDLTSSIENLMVTGAGVEAIRAELSEASTIFAKAGVEDPSGSAAASLVQASLLTRDADAITRVLEDPEFAKSLSASTRATLQTARDQLAAQESAIQNRERAEYNRAFNDTTASASMEAMQLFQGGNTRGAVDVIDGMLSNAYNHPDSSVGLSAVKSLDTLKKAMLAPPPAAKLDASTSISLRLQMEQELAQAAGSGAENHELVAIGARYIEQGLSESQVFSGINAGFAFAEDRTDTYGQELDLELKTIAGEFSSAVKLIDGGDVSFLGINEVDSNMNIITNQYRLAYERSVAEQTAVLQAQGPDWQTKLGVQGYEEVHNRAKASAARAVGNNPASQLTTILQDDKAARRLLGNPETVRFLKAALGDDAVTEYLGQIKAKDAAVSAAVGDLTSGYLNN